MKRLNCPSALILLLISLFSFSCATLSSLGKESTKKGYPAYSTAPLSIPSVSKYVNGIADNLVKQESIQKIGFPKVNVVVVKTSRIQGRNFRGTPRIEITRGMLNLMINEAELACLISHEIGHKALHGKSDYKKEQEDKSFKDKIGDILLSDEEQLAKWSQKREQEADEYGAILCYKSGYDAYALVGFFDRLSQFQEKGFLASLSELTATHKDFRNRSKHLRVYLERSDIQPGGGKLYEKEYQQSLASLKGIHTDDVVNEVLPGGAALAIQKLNAIENELKSYERTKQPLPVNRFIDIMDELRGISEEYGVDISSIKTASLNHPPASAYYVFMKEVLSQDTPVWGNEEEIAGKIKDVLLLLGRIGVGFIPVVGDVVDLYELLVGEDFITGAKLTFSERTITAVALLAGSGKMWREIASGVDETLDSAKLAKKVGKGSIKESQRALNEAVEIRVSANNMQKYGPLRKGPLHSKTLGSGTAADTFRSSTYISYKNTNSMTLYRVQNRPVEAGDKIGAFWTRTKPSGSMQSMIDSSLDPGWGNKATHWVKIEVPVGQTIHEGSAAAQRGLIGGGNQVYLEDIQHSWIKEQGKF